MRSASDATLTARTALRRALRTRRSALTAAARANAAQLITLHVANSHWLRAERPIGLYVSVGSEVATVALRSLALRRRCRVFLPRIVDHANQRMQFVRDCGPQRLNRHGIPEPIDGQRLGARWLSVAFVPLLGFDSRGHRLGSGAGYYDRVFAYRRHRLAWHRPLLIGLAYECQRLPHIDAQPHDVRLDAVVTEAGVLWCRP